jgi:hypothetical protein
VGGGGGGGGRAASPAAPPPPPPPAAAPAASPFARQAASSRSPASSHHLGRSGARTQVRSSPPPPAHAHAPAAASPFSAALAAASPRPVGASPQRFGGSPGPVPAFPFTGGPGGDDDRYTRGGPLGVEELEGPYVRTGTGLLYQPRGGATAGTKRRGYDEGREGEGEAALRPHLQHHVGPVAATTRGGTRELTVRDAVLASQSPPRFAASGVRRGSVA